MIIQNEPQTDGHMAELSMTVPRDDVSLARSSLDGLRQSSGSGRSSPTITWGRSRSSAPA
jgi:hypothetical protein